MIKIWFLLNDHRLKCLDENNFYNEAEIQEFGKDIGHKNVGDYNEWAKVKRTSSEETTRNFPGLVCNLLRYNWSTLIYHRFDGKKLIINVYYSYRFLPRFGEITLRTFTNWSFIPRVHTWIIRVPQAFIIMAICIVYAKYGIGPVKRTTMKLLCTNRTCVHLYGLYPFGYKFEIFQGPVAKTISSMICILSIKIQYYSHSDFPYCDLKYRIIIR